jgi:hypothetical protein
METRMAVDKTSSIPPGSTVEVWNRSLGRFAGQFEVADTTASGVKVRRLSDSQPLPEAFTVDEVRRLSEDDR